MRAGTLPEAPTPTKQRISTHFSAYVIGKRSESMNLTDVGQADKIARHQLAKGDIIMLLQCSTAMCFLKPEVSCKTSMKNSCYQNIFYF